MQAELTIQNLENYKEEVFYFPLDSDEITTFLDDDNSEYKITDIEDEYNFFMDLEGYNCSLNFLDDFYELIDKSDNVKDTINLLLSVSERESYSIHELHEQFDNIQNSYELTSFRTVEEYFFDLIVDNEFPYMNFTPQSLQYYLSNDSKNRLVRDISAGSDDYELLDRLYESDTYGFLLILDEYDFDLKKITERYLDYSLIARDLRASGFLVSETKYGVLIYHG
ncbi:hypothetical protein ACH5BK_06065 [Arcobacter sp. YIC-80]|uniref:hypothetical protein n=1 Tax=Arcobacter sp. YIC-80 TaxID=3376683 RepID=UPI00384C7D98